MTLLTHSVFSDTPHFTFIDDAALSTTVAEVREEFLRNKPFDRFDVVILLKEEGTTATWRRGGYNPEAIAYPASCVKRGSAADCTRSCIP